MIAFMKRLWSDRRGNALVMAGAALPLLIGSVGLATDTIQWALWKRQLQRAADSAAYAGVYARFQQQSSTTGVTRDLANNNHLWVPLLSGYPQVSEPNLQPTYTNTVQVSLAVQQELGFSSMFMAAAPVITVTARAAAIDSDDFCVVALENTNNSGIIIQGSAIINLGCGMISNSPAASISVGVNGNGHYVTAEPVAGVGGVPDINGVTREQSNHLPQLDPYVNEDGTPKYSTSVPPSETCTAMNHPSKVESTTGGVTTLKPGCYSGGNGFKFTNGSYHLQPGTYFLDSTDFVANGGTITGTGVTIILTGTPPGQVTMNGNATIQLSAPTSGPYAKMLLIQSPNATNLNNSNTFNGTATSTFDGAIYMPKQQVTFSGNTGAMTKCAMVVARRVEFAGNANMQNNTIGCTANDKVKGKTIRLIA